jgi:ATP-dependent Clp endopeptidase proteolytic subunit ClpP
VKDYCDWDFLNRDFSAEDRQRLAKSGEAMPDGSFPIVTTEDLDNAIKAIGRASNPGAAKKHIIKRARALNAEDRLPDDWKGGQANSWEPRKPKALLKKGDWYRIENKADTSAAEVFIYDEIGGFGVTSGDFLNDLRGIEGDVKLHLNSPGGDVFDGLTIYQALKSRAGETTVVVDGLAASIASVIAMGADKVVMAPKATMMIHEGWTAAIGNSADMRKLADLLDKTSANIASVYADKAGGTVEFWRDRMRDETWYSADEAMEAGLIDEVEGKVNRKRDDFDLSMYAHAGRDKAPDPVLKSEHGPESVGFKGDETVIPKKDEDEPFTWDFAEFKSALKGV